MTTELVKGMPVVSLADGATLGVIDHVYFDPQCMAVVGFTVHQRNGLFASASSGLVDISDVHAFGPDAVTVDDISVVRSERAVESARGELLDLDDLIRRPVMTAGGTLLGHVAAIRFGDHSHILVALDIDSAEAAGRRRISAREIQTIGAELVIIKDRVRVTTPLEVLPRRSLRPLALASGFPMEDRRHGVIEVLGAWWSGSKPERRSMRPAAA
jgi:uncharacterized protein YrrD